MDRSANLDTEELKVGYPPGAVVTIWVGPPPVVSAAAWACVRGAPADPGKGLGEGSAGGHLPEPSAASHPSAASIVIILIIMMIMVVMVVMMVMVLPVCS